MNKYLNKFSMLVYLDIDEEPLQVKFSLSGNLTARMWDISVVQLEIDDIAPPGCLQYHKSGTGIISTFNYTPSNGRVIANSKYLICIKKQPKICSIVYTQCSNDSFNIGYKKAKSNSGNVTRLRPAINDLTDNDLIDNGGSGSNFIFNSNILSPNFARNLMKRAFKRNNLQSIADPSLQTCNDRIIIPCEVEHFITVSLKSKMCNIISHDF